ncbi:MAG: hypothetical protein P8X63_03820 [Desulfuromonadaceae bacterium]
MHTPLLVVAVPLLLFLLVLFGRGAINIIRAFRNRQRPRLLVIISFLAGLLLLDGVLSLALLLNAALSHSETAKSTASVYSVLLFLVLVGLPALILWLLYHRNGFRNPSDWE